MKVKLFLTPLPFETEEISRKTVAVIDVLRASTTIVRPLGAFTNHSKCATPPRPARDDTSCRLARLTTSASPRRVSRTRTGLLDADPAPLAITHVEKPPTFPTVARTR